MPEHDLRSYLDRLDLEGGDQLVRVRRRVDPLHELSEVVKRLEPYGTPAVRFDDVAGSPFPVVAGLFGRRERVASMLGLAPRDAVRITLTLAEAPGATRVVADPPVQEVCYAGEEVDLGILPAPVHSKGDAGRYISSAVGISRDPDSGRINTGVYRLMLLGPRTMTVNVVPGNRLGRTLQRARREGSTVEMVFAIGAAPSFVLASQFSAGKHRDCYELAAAFAGGELQVAPGRSLGLDVPATSEIVLEGVVDPSARVPDGPFGEFSYYAGQNLAATCTVTAITHRRDAVYHDIHPTHREHRYLWAYPGREAWLLRELSRLSPCVREVVIPEFGAFFSLFLSVEPEHAGDARQALLAALACDNMIKHAVAVDTDVDIWDPGAVAWAVNTRFQAERDLVVIEGLSGVQNDPSSRPCREGDRPDHVTTKVGVDATLPVGGDFPERADEPAEGFELLNLGDYIEPELLSALRRRWSSVPTAHV